MTKEWHCVEKLWRYHDEWSPLAGPAAKKKLGPAATRVFGLGTSLGTPFSKIPPRLFHTLSHSIVGSIIDDLQLIYNHGCPLPNIRMSNVPPVFYVHRIYGAPQGDPIDKWAYEATAKQTNGRHCKISGKPGWRLCQCLSLLRTNGSHCPDQRFSLSLNFKVYAGGGIPGDGSLSCSLLHANNQMFRSIVIRWLNVCTPDKLISGLNIVILYVTLPILLLCPRSLLHPPIPIACLSHSTSTARTDPTCMQNHLQKIATKNIIYLADLLGLPGAALLKQLLIIK